MEKPIIMHFHKEKDHKDFLQLVRETAEQGKETVSIKEHDEAIVIEIIKITV